VPIASIYPRVQLGCLENALWVQATGSNVTTDIEHSPRSAAPARSIDEVQELIGRVEEMLTTLDEWGDENSERLRRKLNDNVSLARGSLIQVQQRSSAGTRRVLGAALTTVSLASLSGFVIGFLVASYLRINGHERSAGARRDRGLSSREKRERRLWQRSSRR
jgi:ElaB/YqjD/DUF883 family membrane-anchored ribosome-binding protein